MTTREAAELLGVSARTLHRYIEKGILHPKQSQTNKRLVFDRAEVEAVKRDLEEGKLRSVTH